MRELIQALLMILQAKAEQEMMQRQRQLELQEMDRRAFQEQENQRLRQEQKEQEAYKKSWHGKRIIHASMVVDQAQAIGLPDTVVQKLAGMQSQIKELAAMQLGDDALKKPLSAIDAQLNVLGQDVGILCAAEVGALQQGDPDVVEARERIQAMHEAAVEEAKAAAAPKPVIPQPQVSGPGGVSIASGGEVPKVRDFKWPAIDDVKLVDQPEPQEHDDEALVFVEDKPKATAQEKKSRKVEADREIGD